MVNNLYETLGVSNDASVEEIRKAYRKAALRTHPDRLPPGSTEKEIKRAGERFQLVNNAYEVLSDENKRRIYDRHGEYPPPEVQQDPYADRAHRHRHHRHRPHTHTHRHGFSDPFGGGFPFNDPFSTHPFGASSSRSRTRNNAFPGFTDPFTLFDSMFGDMRRQFDDPFFADARPTASGSSSFGNPFGTDPFGHGSLFDRMTGGHSAFGMLPPTNGIFPQTGAPFQAQSHSMNFQSSSRGGLNGDGQWVSQSRITRTVNGVTESVWKRTDSSGNEHITYSYPDGRERHLLNGVEQSSGSLGDRHLPPPPPYSAPAPINTSHHSIERGPRVDMNHSPTGPYSSANIKHEHEYERERDRHQGYHERKHRHDHEDHEHRKKHWWKGEW